MGPGQSHVPAFDAAGCCLRSWWSTSGNSLGLAFNWTACDAPGCCCIAGGNTWQFFTSCPWRLASTAATVMHLDAAA
jgi:hypothetical protein